MKPTKIAQNQLPLGRGDQVDSPLSDARWQCKRDPFSMSYGYVNICQKAITRINIERGVLKHYSQPIISDFMWGFIGNISHQS